MTTITEADTTADEIDGLARQLRELARALDIACDALSSHDWQRVVEIIPWHENATGTAAKALHELAASIRNGKQ